MEYEIIVEPKMSFGTGRHETTSLIMEAVIQHSLLQKIVLDVGCGTGILSILAEKMGAKKIAAIDNDKWAYNNEIENTKLNVSESIEVKLGEINSINNQKFEVLLANINKNVILNDLRNYNDFLVNNGEMLLSGFYFQDKMAIDKKQLN